MTKTRAEFGVGLVDSKIFAEQIFRRLCTYLGVVHILRNQLIHDVNPSQLGEAQWCISPILREALLSARRGPVVHRATSNQLAEGRVSK